MISHQLPPLVRHDPDARETIFGRNGLAPILSDHRGATGFHRGISIDAHANLGGGNGLVRQGMRCEVSDDLCLVAHDAGRTDAEKVIGIDSAKRDGVGSDLRANPLLILLLNGLFGLVASRVRTLCCCAIPVKTADSRSAAMIDVRIIRPSMGAQS